MEFVKLKKPIGPLLPDHFIGANVFFKKGLSSMIRPAIQTIFFSIFISYKVVYNSFTESSNKVTSSSINQIKSPLAFSNNKLRICG